MKSMITLKPQYSVPMWDTVGYHYSVGADHTLLVVCFTSGKQKDSEIQKTQIKIG